MVSIFSSKNKVFKARSQERDARTDYDRLAAIAIAIDEAIRAAETERNGLSKRVEDILARAAVSMGNGTDEYLYREDLDTRHLNFSEKEIANGQRRVNELIRTVEQFQHLRTVLIERFPDFKLVKREAKTRS
jgi:hypothetical protein